MMHLNIVNLDKHKQISLQESCSVSSFLIEIFDFQSACRFLFLIQQLNISTAWIGCT